MKPISDVIVEHPGTARAHRDLLQNLITASIGEIRVASAYVTDRDLLLTGKGRKRRLLTSLVPMDIASGATSLECLRALLEESVEIRYSPSYPRLHAKVYLFGNNDAVVTSANMTRNAMESNVEVGVRVSGQNAQVLIDWYEQIWKDSDPVDIEMLASLSRHVKVLRRRYSELKATASKHFAIPGKKTQDSQSTLAKTLSRSKQFYLVNTNRRHDYKTETGGYGMEENMLDQGLAVVWESFNFPSHMSAVRRGDVIMAFAKRAGIIAVGVAKGGLEVLQGASDRRIRSFEDFPSPEWRVPTHWIVRVDDEDALPYRDAPNASFVDVSGDLYASLRKSITDHFAK